MPQTKFLLDESDIPKHWYNVVADMPNPPTPPLAAGWTTHRAGSVDADLSDGPDRTGSLGRTLDSDSRTGARSFAHVPSLTAVPRA